MLMQTDGSGGDGFPVQLLIGIILGGVVIGVIWFLQNRATRESRRHEAEQVIRDAQSQADGIIKSAEVKARDEFIRKQEEFDSRNAETREELKKVENRLAKREDNIDRKLETLEVKEKGLEKLEQRLISHEKELQHRDEELSAIISEQQDKLLSLSGLSREEAKKIVLERVEADVQRDADMLIDRTLTEARDSAQMRAREITLTAIQRFAADHTSEGTVSAVEIPSDELKGRVIGREGRNIRAFERATGCDVIVDDTPGVIVVSAFHPIRRETARRTLEKLIQDGRIHPARIEEIAKETKKEVEAELLEIGKRASIEANIGKLHRKQVELLGALHYRTSYGQNVLKHSIEVAYLCQIMAEELELDGRLARRCGLLHDIGKAVDHEVEGSHPQIGYDICKRFREPPEVLNAVAGHHGDVEATSPYTPLVMAADAISAARPGGRRESFERYIKRLEQLEGIATQHEGVIEAYAIQAGREIRVIVNSEHIDDSAATRMARDIAQEVELEMTYPGEVKVTVLRELRAVDYAR
jgi:ribonuclease Y